MDKSQAEKLVDEHILPLIEAMGLKDWKIRVDQCPTAPSAGDSSGTAGACSTNVDYKFATIAINPELMETSQDLVETLVHELIHIVLSPFTVAWNALEPVLDQHPDAKAVVTPVWTHAEERAVANVIRLWTGAHALANTKRRKARERATRSL
jgi:hypothetical protein